MKILTALLYDFQDFAIVYKSLIFQEEFLVEKDMNYLFCIGIK